MLVIFYHMSYNSCKQVEVRQGMGEQRVQEMHQLKQFQTVRSICIRDTSKRQKLIAMTMTMTMTFYSTTTADDSKPWIK